MQKGVNLDAFKVLMWYILTFLMQMVETNNITSKGLMVVLITDGDETVRPLVETKLPAIKRMNIVINTVSLGPNATDNLEVWVSGRDFFSFTYMSTASCQR